MNARSITWPSRSQRYALAVLLPTLLVALYLALWASKGYVSRTQVMVEQDNSAMAAAAEMTLGLLTIGGQRSKTDALIVETFMRSRAMLDYLDAELALRAHFSSPDVDIVSRLAHDASGEEFLRYYQQRLHTQVHDETYVLDVEFVAFDPAYAQQVTQLLVKRAEKFVNDVAQQLARDQLAFVTDELAGAHQRLKAASQALITLQQQYDVLSPEGETQVSGMVLTGLMQELVKARTERSALLSYLNARAPEVSAVNARIRALEQQVSAERSKQVGGASGARSGKGLNEVMLAYQDAEVDLKLATEVYKGALATMEKTRLETARKGKYLVSMAAPNLPDDDERPRTAYWTLTFFVLLNLIYFVLSLIVATIQDHRD
ncbi:hypothetical protein [Sinimarinibacterium sp. NLF-5-8]|uniref:hypothetical protein n=1 Tax=Sinimarinibacterium sp. NLF-5-8 TaxID=2698684 RepID=UPI00137C3E37|nr:hypothetical protein [Sinimarinibacterium sp. NLF-5-8]QHS10545.1 hypothetical protein GT972_10655 [Sinimarinibacterium sp. NLF-5-8]